MHIEDIEYRRQDERSLLARIFRPDGPGPFPAVIEVHGGAWYLHDRSHDDELNAGLAGSGILVAAIDFRMPPEAGYPASLADINYAVRWLKSRPAGLPLGEGGICLMGVSSGGHQAMLAAMRPRDPRYSALPLAEHRGGIDARVTWRRLVVACNRPARAIPLCAETPRGRSAFGSP